MSQILKKIPFLVELFLNGTFILLYSLQMSSNIPASWDSEVVNSLIRLGIWTVPIVVLLNVIGNYVASANIEDFLRKYLFSLIVFIPLLITWGDIEFVFWLASAHLLSSVLALYDTDSSPKVVHRKSSMGFLAKIKLRPAQVVLLSFVAVIMAGTFLLMLPFSSEGGETLSFIDSLFMATSATCVTGLSTVSLNQNFSQFGQMVILGLIQIGGLGIMTLSTSMTILLGRSQGLKDRVIMQDVIDVSSLEELLAMIMNIIKYTFLIELWGAVVLTIAFIFEGFDFADSIYYGFFHSISAFCNAGFSLFDTSLESYATNPLIHGTVAILITLGGFGFIVLKELKEVIVYRKSLVRMAFHSKIVLITSLILTVGGALFIFFGEFLHSLDGYTLWEKIQVATFQSITLRTAGFNTIPLTNLNPHTLYVMALFMFIGASPGSTGGGIKTTTLAILIQSIKSTLQGKKQVTFWGRTIPSYIVVRVIALTFISLLITCFFIFLLMKLEPEQSFLTIFFEVVSASGTVGLSLGITSYLSVFGKFAISLLMLIGRIGPLTLVLAIGEQSKYTGRVDYPQGRIMIG